MLCWDQPGGGGGGQLTPEAAEEQAAKAQAAEERRGAMLAQVKCCSLTRASARTPFARQQAVPGAVQPATYWP